MRLMVVAAAGLLCTACASEPYADTAAVTAAPTQTAQTECRDFKVPVTVGGNQEEATGQACQQPDGSWRIIQDTPGLPQQVYIVPQPVYVYPDYYWAEPWPPVFFGSSFIFVNHHFRHRGGFRHERFRQHAFRSGGFHGGGFHGGRMR